MKNDEIADLIKKQIRISIDIGEICFLIVEHISKSIDELHNGKNSVLDKLKILENLLIKIREFSVSFVSSRNHSLPAIADFVNTEGYIFDYFIDFRAIIPPVKDIEKLYNSNSPKKQDSTADETHTDLFCYFIFPYCYISIWVCFWNSILELIPIEDPIVSLYQDCRTKFRSVELSLQRNLLKEKFSDDYARLISIEGLTSVYIPSEDTLRWSVKGTILNQLKPKNAQLFIFNERVIVVLENRAISSSFKEIDIIKSPAYPESKNTLLIIGFSESFSFKVDSRFSFLTTLLFWGCICKEKHESYDKFQPVSYTSDSIEDQIPMFYIVKND